MAASAPADRYAVIGHPVAHSLSPRIHRHFAEQTRQALSYEAIELPPDGFARGIRELQRRGFRGVNVTLPFKREAWELCDELSARARIAGAANTLSFADDGRISGDNTDGIGLVRDLVDNMGLAIAGCRVLILGAGGAVRGALGPILEQSPQRLTLANRTAAKAAALAADFSRQGSIDARGFDALGAESFDLVINATAAGIAGEVPAVDTRIIAADTVCYDMMYDIEADTAFVAWALAHGAARAVDGLGMLVEQAAAAFALWRGVEPRTAPVIAGLRASRT